MNSKEEIVENVLVINRGYDVDENTRRHMIGLINQGWQACEKYMSDKNQSGEDFCKELGLQRWEEIKSHIETLQAALTKSESQLAFLVDALETLKVAVNDKQPDAGAVNFIMKALNQYRELK